MEGMKKKIYEYKSLTDDFFDDGSEHKLPENYTYIKNDRFSKFKAGLAYGIALIYANIYCRLCLHIKIKGVEKLRKEKGGFFIYANHTQPIGDVFTPALATFPKRIYTVVSPANFDLPVIGKLIFSLGALPAPSKLKNMKKFREAINQRIKEGHAVVIYPEAHVWPYYTGIRPFSESSFMLPYDTDAPVYVMTSVYKKRKLSKKPKIEVYINGPIYSEGKTIKEKAVDLQDKAYGIMLKNSEMSSCEYIKYKRI